MRVSANKPISADFEVSCLTESPSSYSTGERNPSFSNQDVIAVGMYIVDFDPVYLTKKSIYLIMAVIGLMNWIKLQKERNSENE